MPDVFEKLDKVLPFYKKFADLIMLICKILLISIILITCFSILGRYIPGIPNPPWTEEIVLTAMGYMSMMSGALAINKRSHIRMTAFDYKLPKKLLVCLDILADIGMFYLAIIMVTYGLQFAQNVGVFGRFISMPNFSTFWMYFSVPFAGWIMILFILESFYRNVREFYIPSEQAVEGGV